MTFHVQLPSFPVRRRLVAALAGVVLVTAASAQDPDRLSRMEAAIAEHQRQIQALLGAQADRAADAGAAGARDAWYDRLTLGGYGETHANFVQGSDKDLIDNHRYVLYLGYAFNDWIQFHSETEIEHSFVNDGDGELSLEQFHVDFTLCESVGIRAGRFLVPIGIVNQRHEPPTFHGVERPSVDKVIVPTTWSSDGVGLFGRPTECLEYQFYVGSSLDGSKFRALDGIRGGRLEERPGLHEPAVTGRVDVRPLTESVEHDLRVGTSFFVGGLDNGNKGPSGAPGTLYVWSADAQYSYGPLDLRGVVALEFVDGARSLNAAFGNGVARRMQGWYLEAAVHVLPDSWKTGKLADADVVLFTRYESFDTQAAMPDGAVSDPRGDRQEVTFGISAYPTSKLVLKADYQWRDDESASGLADLFNLGFGFWF